MVKPKVPAAPRPELGLRGGPAWAGRTCFPDEAAGGLEPHKSLDTAVRVAHRSEGGTGTTVQAEGRPLRALLGGWRQCVLWAQMSRVVGAPGAAAGSASPRARLLFLRSAQLLRVQGTWPWLTSREQLAGWAAGPCGSLQASGNTYVTGSKWGWTVERVRAKSWAGGAGGEARPAAPVLPRLHGAWQRPGTWGRSMSGWMRVHSSGRGGAGLPSGAARPAAGQRSRPWQPTCVLRPARGCGGLQGHGGRSGSTGGDSHRTQGPGALGHKAHPPHPCQPRAGGPASLRWPRHVVVPRTLLGRRLSPWLDEGHRGMEMSQLDTVLACPS